MKLPKTLRSVKLWKVIVQASFEQYNRSANMTDFLTKYPTPTDLLDVGEIELMKMFKHMAFFSRIIKKLLKTAEIWYDDDWQDVRDLPCVNGYVAELVEYHVNFKNLGNS